MRVSLMGVAAVSGSMLAGWAGAGTAQEAAVPAARAPEARTIYIWTAGGTASTAGSWGNGSATASRTASGEGGLTIQTRNFYEGARFDLNPPIDLEPYRQSGYLRLRVRFPNTGGRGRGGRGRGGWPGGGGGSPGGWPGVGSPGGSSSSGGGGFPGGMPNMGQPMGDAGTMPGMTAPNFNNQMVPRADDLNGAFEASPLAFDVLNSGVQTRANAQFGMLTPPMQGPDGGPPAGVDIPPDTNFPPGAPGNMPGMTPGMAPGMPPGMMPPERVAPQIQEMQLILVREKGAMIGRFSVQAADSQGGRTYPIALSSLQSTPDAAGRVRRVVLTGDREGTFTLDQFALVTESARMVASIRRAQDPPGAQLDEITVRPGPINLVADVESGIADASVEWNFDADTSGSLPPPAPQATAPGMLPNLGGAPMGQPGTQIPGAPPGMTFGGGGQPGMGATMGLPAPIGPRVDARGLMGRFEYPNEEQNYRVEITVRDRANRKPPVKSSIIVKVRSG